MTASRFLLLISAILFVVAAFCAFDVVHGYSAEGFALLALACWAGSGAV